MKKFLFFGILLTATIGTSQVQQEDKFIIPKGTWTLAGSVSFNNNNADFTSNNGDFTQDNENNSFTIAPIVGYTFRDNWIVGIIPSYTTFRTEFNSFNSDFGISTSEDKSESVTLSSFVRRYFGLNKSLALYLQGEAGYTRTWTEGIRGDGERFTSSQEGVLASIRPGISFFVSKHLAFESSVGAISFSSFTQEPGDGGETRRNNFNTNFNFSNILVGLSYFF
ncbi:MAG: autotransporter outer membrane beta-barrel domain-containing protein [Bacteroidota bacterium]